MEYNRKNRIFKIILGQTLSAVIIISIALFLVYYVQGYRIDFKNMKIIKTGVLVLAYDPKPDKIILNNEEQFFKSNFAKSLRPGHYNLEIYKEGYANWSRNIYVDSEMVANIEDIVLFKESPIITETDQNDVISLINSPDSNLVEFAPEKLSSNGHEIWVNGNLITRFSAEIYNVKWYQDMAHIMYQMGNEIRIIELSGFNDTLLVKLSSNTISRYAVGGKGKELYFSDGEIYKKAAIR